MIDALNRLAQAAGIEDGWWDFFGTFRPVSDDTRRAFLSAMGFTVGDDAQAAESLWRFEERDWRRWLPPVVVAHERHGAPELVLTLPAARDGDEFVWTLDEEIGVVHTDRFVPTTLPWIEERWLDGQLVKRWRLRLPTLPPPGYHRFRLATRDGAEAGTRLIVCPDRAWSPEHLEQGGRIWGVQTQVYALRGPRDWGVGDYGTLAELTAGAARLGAGTVGVNPLHALFPNQPHNFSPYSSSSRAFLNITYLDVEGMDDYRDCPQAQAMVAAPEFQRRLEELRRLELVDYPGVAALKRPVLEAVYAHFRKTHLNGDRGHAFRRFQEQSGRSGELFAVFEALQEQFLKDGNGYWRHWPAEYHSPDGPAVLRFAEQQRERVEFYWYLQWQADVQLATVQAAAQAGAMPVGLYRDVGVGIADDGAEAWSQQRALAGGVTIGAPPDPLAPRGQDWGLTPFNPWGLREAAYQPFIEAIRANMRHAGALRLDHAMQLQRLYWVPRGQAADAGAYVRMPVDDLFGILALESRRNHTVVIGEDLGTVPDGFRERMDAAGVYGYRLFVFERDQSGAFKRPEEFTEQALVALGTHDLPSLVGYWRGIDVAERGRLNLYPREGQHEEEERARKGDRHRLVEALQQLSLLPEHFPHDGELSEHQVKALADAVHACLESTPSRIMMVQPEDALGLVLQFNLPGTVDQHPNWRRRYPAEVATILAHPRLVETARRLLHGRVAPEQRGKVTV
jgi:4-alpha-glucanotransferase